MCVCVYAKTVISRRMGPVCQDRRKLQPVVQEPNTEDSVPDILWKAAMVGAWVGCMLPRHLWSFIVIHDHSWPFTIIHGRSLSFMLPHGHSILGAFTFWRGSTPGLLDLIAGICVHSIKGLQVFRSLCFMLSDVVRSFPALGQSRKLPYLFISFLCSTSNVGYTLQFCQSLHSAQINKVLPM